ncbi:formylglycine-generating enzyme family protein [Geminocystis sp. CENA526]|uniref:formylglycine-generating enzyme family protein n=1 Tax=Geminocystis sp. CENA526 TaxID=1355871 RepID=UPI003D6E0069
MNNLPREKLIQIIKENGISITNNPQQCKAFLLDYCGEYRLEINVLMNALQEGIIKELKNIHQGIPLESILAKLRQKLETNLAMREDAAQWAVDSWALALGIITELELKSLNVGSFKGLNDTSNEGKRTEDKLQQIITSTKINNVVQTIGKSVINGNFTEVLPHGIKLEMVAIPEGEFMMGSQEYKLEQPIHKVKLRAFFMGKYPVTQEQYQAIMGENPSKFKGLVHPVEKVDWLRATQFCQKLSQITGKKYQLPSEAQWEYACRAGSETKYYFGDNPYLLEHYAWYKNNSQGETHPVGMKKPNQWGLYDMYGNVWEWCEDLWHSHYIDAPTNDYPWITGLTQSHVVRGGGFDSESGACRSTHRSNAGSIVYQGYLYGFRIVYIP